MWYGGKAPRLVLTEFLIFNFARFGGSKTWACLLLAPEPDRNFFHAAPLTRGVTHRHLLYNYIVVCGEVQLWLSLYI